jgi:hypothetical protein
VREPLQCEVVCQADVALGMPCPINLALNSTRLGVYRDMQYACTIDWNTTISEQNQRLLPLDASPAPVWRGRQGKPRIQCTCHKLRNQPVGERGHCPHLVLVLTPVETKFGVMQWVYACGEPNVVAPHDLHEHEYSREPPYSSIQTVKYGASDVNSPH